MPPFPQRLMGVAMRMEGRKAWPKSGGFTFEPTHYNLQLFREAFPEVGVDDDRETVALWSGVANGVGSQPGLGNALGRPAYIPKTPPYGDYQLRALNKGLATPNYGLFMEQGTGKSWVVVQMAGHRWSAGEITALLIIAFNGVHFQWVEEAIPEHMGEMVPHRTWAYKSGRKVPEWLKRTDKLAIFTINFEACWTKAGRAAMDEFLQAHAGNVMGVVDEGQRIKNPEAKSSVEIFEIGPYCKYRIDLTGTPLVKDLTDIYSQFQFIEPRAIGHKYVSTFRSQYCRMHPKFRGIVVGSKREVDFYKKIEPYIFRVTKDEELDLPPKVYDTFEFELHPQQRKLYDQLRSEFLGELDSGNVVTIKHALTLVTRLHQVTCGYIALDKENPEDPVRIEHLPWNPRLDALKQVLRARIGKAVIWSRFTPTIEMIMREFNDAVSYFGGTGKDERIENKRRYIEDEAITRFVSNQAAGGTGVDGLQKVTRTAIYYTNSYNSAHRWQSEDRTHRIGMTGTCTYIDLVARNTVDRKILRRLRRNKELSDFVLDDIRQMLIGDHDANDKEGAGDN